jgi:cobalt/nickel transport protein
MRQIMGLTLLSLAIFGAPAGAHFTMLLPSAAATKKGEAVTLTCQWGHPFEHQLFDTLPPVSLTVRRPDGKKTDLTAALEKTEVAPGQGNVTAYRVRFTPEARGDYVFLLKMPPVWMEEDGEFLEDRVQLVLHVQAQKGWDAAWADLVWELLTRPYGLQPGMAFQARRRIWPSALVEVERYNAEPPRKLPPDEHITRTVKTDDQGVVTATLPEAGWWCLTASVRAGTRERHGKAYPVRERATLWVYVDEKPAAP